MRVLFHLLTLFQEKAEQEYLHDVLSSPSWQQPSQYAFFFFCTRLNNMGRASNNVPMMLGIAESNLFLPVFMILFLFYLADLNIISEVYDSWRTNFRKAGVLHEVLQPLGKWIYRSQNIYCSCVLSSPSSSSRDSVASRTPHLNLLLYSNFPPEQR